MSHLTGALLDGYSFASFCTVDADGRLTFCNALMAIDVRLKENVYTCVMIVSLMYLIIL